MAGHRRWKRGTQGCIGCTCGVALEPLPPLTTSDDSNLPSASSPPSTCIRMTRATMDDELEADIGLTDLSLPPHSPTARPRILTYASSSGGNAPIGPGRTPSMNGQLKSPSSPNLVEKSLPPNPARRRVSRSKTLPRMPHTAMHRTRLSLDGLAMGPEKVAKLRRWILGLVTGESP